MKEISRRELIFKTARILLLLSPIGLSRSSGKEDPIRQMIAEQGIKFSESERRLWIEDIPIERWNPEDYENQQSIAGERLKHLAHKMVFSQNKYFRDAYEFLADQRIDSKIKFTLSKPGEKGGETTRSFPVLAQDGKILYEIELALPGWRSNLSAEGGLRDIDLALQLVHEVAHIEYYQNLEREGISRGLSGDELLEFVRKPNEEFEARVDAEAFAYGEYIMSYLYVIGMTKMRKENSLVDDLAEIFIQNNFDVESRAWKEAVREKTISCQHTE